MVIYFTKDVSPISILDDNTQTRRGVVNEGFFETNNIAVAEILIKK